MGVRFTAILSGVVMLIGAGINWYRCDRDVCPAQVLTTGLPLISNYIPGLDELGVSPFYEGMPASAKFSSVGFMIFGCGVEWLELQYHVVL